jgi:DNA polymerase I-like protein with 3'-5' exonuclease and polymerase domains
MNMNPKTKEAYQLIHEGTLALADAELAGFRVDVDYVTRKKAFIEKKRDYLDAKFKETDFFKHWQHSIKGTVNTSSPTQLAHFLYKVKKYPILKETDSGQGSTDEETLKQLHIPEIDLLLEKTRYKKAVDVLNGFEREQVNGIIHPFYNLNLVRSFRSSSDSPNFQNIPVRDEEIMQICRKAIYPRPGHQFLEIDYSGVEVRTNACINKDPKLIKYVSDPTTDMHRDVAMQLFFLDKFDKNIPSHATLRQAAKNGFVFPEFYGSYYKNTASGVACNWGQLGHGKWKPGQGIAMPEEFLSDHFIKNGIKSLTSFETHVKNIEDDFWGNRFVVYSEWKNKNWNNYKKAGYVDLPTGFRCGGVMDKKQVNNYPGQGSAFHCLLWSFIKLNKTRISQNWDSLLVGQIHDSIIIDVNPKELEHVARIAKRITTQDLPNAWKWISVPLDVEMKLCPVDGSWAHSEKFRLEN